MTEKCTTRRRALGLAGAVLTVSVAGCSNGGDGDQGGQQDGSSPSLTVNDQQSDGSRLTVTKAAIDDQGWLVIHPEADGGGPNAKVVLAKKQLSPETYSEVSLQLTPSLSTTQTVYAVLHYDDPKDGKLTFPDGDPPVKTNDGSLIKPLEITVDSGS